MSEALANYRSAFDDGIERAALHLQRKADQMRKDNPGPTADMMARIFEAEAEEILALRKSPTVAGLKARIEAAQDEIRQGARSGRPRFKL